MKYTLAENNLINIRSGRKGVHINCIKGRIWLTQKNDIHDYFLVNGDNISLTHNGKIVIEAFCDSCLVIEGLRFHIHELKNNNMCSSVNNVNIQPIGQLS